MSRADNSIRPQRTFRSRLLLVAPVLLSALCEQGFDALFALARGAALVPGYLILVWSLTLGAALVVAVVAAVLPVAGLTPLALWAAVHGFLVFGLSPARRVVLAGGLLLVTEVAVRIAPSWRRRVVAPGVAVAAASRSR